MASPSSSAALSSSGGAGSALPPSVLSRERSSQPQQRVLLTYSGPGALLHSPFCAHVLDSVRSQFPLRNLHWRRPPVLTSSSAAALTGAGAVGSASAPHGQPPPPRTIASLDVELVELSAHLTHALAQANAFIPPSSMLDRPFIHLYFVVCDDLEHYRTAVKPEITRWLQTLRSTRAIQMTPQRIANRGLKMNGLSSGVGGSGGASAGAQAEEDADAEADDEELEPEYLILLISPQDAATANAAAESSGSSSVLSPGESITGSASGSISPGSTSKVGRLVSSLSRNMANVVDKLRQDFNTPPKPGQATAHNMGAGRRDRVVHLTRLPPLLPPGSRGAASASAKHSVDPTMFADLLNRVKDLVHATLDSFVRRQTAEIARAENAKARLLASAAAHEEKGPGSVARKDVLAAEAAAAAAAGGAAKRQDGEDAGARGVGVAAALSMWDFCSWASAKEFLARSFEGLQLPEDAWGQYRDIDLEIVSAVQERSHPYFQQLGGLTAGDDTATILDDIRKPYRDQLQRGEITLFDCRCYIFARQARLLSRMAPLSSSTAVPSAALSDLYAPRGMTGLMREAVSFLLGLGRMLAHRQSMPAHYLEAWIYTQALLIVEQCAQWLVDHGEAATPAASMHRATATGSLPISGSVENDLAAASARVTSPVPTDAQLNIAFHLAKAELFGLARRQLEKLGVETSLLPRQPPFSDSLPEDVLGRQVMPALSAGFKDQEGQEVRMSNSELRKTLESKDVFDIQYTALAERELAAWMTAGRSKNVILIRGILGHLSFARGRFAEAYETFTALPDAYGEENWNAVEEDQLVMLLESHEKLGRQRDEQWAKSAVMLLRAKALAMQLEEHSWLSSPPSRQASAWASEEHLWSCIREAADRFPEQQPVTGYPGFVVRPVGTQVEQLADEDGSTLNVAVESRASVPVAVDDVRLCLTSAKRDQLWFASGATTINPGRSRIQLFCPSPPPGRYVVDLSQVRVANLVFQEVFGKAALSTQVPGMPGAHPDAARLVNIPEDGDALYASIGLPQEVNLDRQRCAELTIESGRNELQTAEVGITLLDGTPLGGLLDAELAEGQTPETPLSFVDGQQKIQIHEVPRDTSTRVLIPLHESSQDGVLRLIITVDYITKERSEVTRHFRRRVDLRIALPLGVNVQDFFRGSSLFSKFSISSGGVSRLRIQPAELTGTAEGFEVQAPGSQETSVVTPQQPAVFVFKITRSSSSIASSEGLRLILRYRTLGEEARGIVLSILDDVLSKASAKVPSTRRRCLNRALGRLVEERLDVERFAIAGEIFAAEFNEHAWNVTCSRWGLAEDSEERRVILEAVRDTLQQARDQPPIDAASEEQRGLPWRMLSIPVDVPQMSIVNSVQLKLSDGPLPLIVGQPRSATVVIQTTFRWGPPPAAASETASAAASPAPSKVSLPVNPRSSVYAESEVDLDFEDAQSDITDTPTRRQKAEPTTADAASEVEQDMDPVPPTPFDLVYDVHATYNSWLISGEHHGVLSNIDSSTPPDNTREDAAVQTFKVQLIPLRHGSLLLPIITVKAVPKGGEGASADPAESADGGEDAANLPSCETFQDNAADRVDVVPRRSRATYWVDLPTGAHWNAQGGTRVIPAA